VITKRLYCSFCSSATFTWSFELKYVGWSLENYFLTGVLEPHENLTNMINFEQFSSNHVGDPFRPQNVGAQALKGKNNVSQLS